MRGSASDAMQRPVLEFPNKVHLVREPEVNAAERETCGTPGTPGGKECARSSKADLFRVPNL